MTADDIQALARELRVQPADLDYLEDVDPDVRRRLHDAVLQARLDQERALAEAFEQTIRLVPRPLRSRIRRVLVGGGA